MEFVQQFAGWEQVWVLGECLVVSFGGVLLELLESVVDLGGRCVVVQPSGWSFCFESLWYEFEVVVVECVAKFCSDGSSPAKDGLGDMLCFVVSGGNYGIYGWLVVCVANLPESWYAVFSRGEHGFGDVVGTVVQHKFGDGFELFVELLVGSGRRGSGAVTVLHRMVLSSSEGKEYHQFHPCASLGFPVGRLHGKAMDESPDFAVEVGVVVVGGCALVWFGEGGFGIVGVVGAVVGKDVRYSDLVVSWALGEFV